MNINILTADNAVKEYHMNRQTLKKWIHKGYVKAENVGGTYQIDRDSLVTHLATTKRPKIDSTGKDVPEVAGTIQPEGEIIAPTLNGLHNPGDEGAGARAIVMPSTLSTDALLRALTETEPEPQANMTIPAPCPAQTEGMVIASQTGRKQKRSSPQTKSKPPGTIAKGPRGQNRVPGRKGPDRKALGGPKKFKKGPVRYAKDCMRQFDAAQMRDVRDWLLRRLDVKFKLA